MNQPIHESIKAIKAIKAIKETATNLRQEHERPGFRGVGRPTLLERPAAGVATPLAAGVAAGVADAAAAHSAAAAAGVAAAVGRRLRTTRRRSLRSEKVVRKKKNQCSADGQWR